MSNMIKLNGFALETTGKRLRLIEGILEFPDIPGPEDFRGKVTEEICLVVMLNRLYFLSLFLKCRVQILGTVKLGRRLGVDFLVDRNVEPSELMEFDKTLDKMMTMRRELVEAYLNSCSAFHSALVLEQSNYSVAFVLLVIAVECLSNTCYSEKHMKGFKKFFADYMLEDRTFLESELRPSKRGLTKEETSSLLQKMIGSIYGRVRSGFVHHGKHVPSGSIMAESLGLAYIKTGKGPKPGSQQKEKEDLNPSLGWFKRIVGETLLNFLTRQKSEERNDLYLLVREEFMIRVKAGEKGVQKGQIPTVDDLELQ